MSLCSSDTHSSSSDELRFASTAAESFSLAGWWWCSWSSSAATHGDDRLLPAIGVRFFCMSPRNSENSTNTATIISLFVGVIPRFKFSNISAPSSVWLHRLVNLQLTYLVHGELGFKHSKRFTSTLLIFFSVGRPSQHVD